MNIYNIHQAYNNPIKENNLINILDVKESARLRHGVPSNNQVQNTLNKFGIDIKYVFFDKGNELSSIIYYKDTVYISIPSLDEEVFSSFEIDKRIKSQTKAHAEWINNGEFEKLFSFVDEKILFLAYKKLFNKIPDNNKFDLFLLIYNISEYGFGEFLDKEFIKKVIEYRKYSGKNVKNISTKNRYITIYRGESSNSTNVENAYSWTTNINTAIFFATRFNQSEKSKLYKAKVNINDIIANIYDRDENEVLVFYEDVKDIEVKDILKFEEVFNDKVADIYHSNISKLKPIYFHNAEGIHGILHAKRVLLLSTILGILSNLANEEIELLIDASLYHDIGRTNDNNDNEHGMLSFEKLKSLNLVNKDKSYMETLRYIITEHSISDKEAFNNINKYKIKNKEKAIKLLKIFKDADGLDRIRINSLDVNYLRTEHAIKLVGVANELLVGIK